MRASTLPSPGHLRISQQLRILAAQAISAAETRGQRAGGTSPELLAFFTACAAAVTAAAPLTGIDATPATTSKVVGQTQQITVAPIPSTSALPAVTYSSSDVTKATVSAAGLITAVAAGTATITVTGKGFTDTVVVTVTAS
jgi:uncharacterized protein YjdB